MSSLIPYLNNSVVSVVLHLLVIFAVALVLNRFLRVVAKLVVKPAASQSRSEQIREQ